MNALQAIRYARIVNDDRRCSFWSLRRQQCLYFLPLSQEGQGELRPGIFIPLYLL